LEVGYIVVQQAPEIRIGVEGGPKQQEATLIPDVGELDHVAFGEAQQDLIRGEAPAFLLRD
jgi:hypothetical protein